MLIYQLWNCEINHNALGGGLGEAKIHKKMQVSSNTLYDFCARRKRCDKHSL